MYMQKKNIYPNVQKKKKKKKKHERVHCERMG